MKPMNDDDNKEQLVVVFVWRRLNKSNRFGLDWLESRLKLEGVRSLKKRKINLI